MDRDVDTGPELDEATALGGHEQEEDADDETASLGGSMGAWGARLGVDLGDVRVHSGPAAERQAAALGARALADGNDIFLGGGEREDDLELMGHEVAHVAQAKKGAAAGPHGKREGDGSAIEIDADRAGHALAHASGPVSVGATSGGVRLKGGWFDVFDVSSYFPQPPAQKAAPASEAPGVRKRLLKAIYEARSVSEEINEHEPGELGASRAYEALSRLFNVVRADDGPKSLTDDEKAGMKSVAESAIHVAFKLYADRPTTALMYNGIKSLLTSSFGHMPDPANDPWQTLRRDRATPEEAKVLISEQLEEAKSELQQELDREDTGASDLSGGAGIARLASAKGLLRELGREKETIAGELHALVEDITEKVARLRSRYDQGRRARELAIRISDVRVLLAMSGFSPESMKDLLEEEAKGARTYTPEEGAEFDRLAGKVQIGVRSMLGHRRDAVAKAQEDAREAEPPSTGISLDDLALGALKIATGGVGGVLIEHVVQHAFGDPKDGGLILKAFEKAISKVAEKGLEYVIDKAFEAVTGGAEMPETPAQVKSLFFDSQRETLQIASDSTEMSVVDDVAALKVKLGADPERTLRALEALATFDTTRPGDIKEEQRRATLAQYAAALARAQLDTAALANVEDEGTDLGKGLGLEVDLGSRSGMAYDINVHGAISMEFDAGASPTDPVKLVKAWVKGLNPELRRDLEQMDMVKLGIPMRARGFPGASLVSIARNEHGDVFAEEAGKWLIEKVDGNTSDFSTERENARDRERAARKILEEEIGSRSIRDWLGEGGLHS